MIKNICQMCLKRQMQINIPQENDVHIPTLSQGEIFELKRLKSLDSTPVDLTPLNSFVYCTPSPHKFKMKMATLADESYIVYSGNLCGPMG